MSENATGSRLDQLAEDLAEDHLVVDPVMANGHYADYVEVLSDDIDAAPWPMYVAVVGRLPGDELPPEPGQVAQLLHQRIGEDGVYIVASDGMADIIAPGVEELWSTAVSNARSDVGREFQGGPTAAANAHVMAALAPEIGLGDDADSVDAAVDDMIAAVEAEPWLLRREFDLDTIDFGSTRNPADPDVVSVVAVGLGLLVALVIGRVLSWRVGIAGRPEQRRTKAPRPTPTSTTPVSPVTPILRAARKRLDAIGAVPDTDGDDRLAALVSEHWSRIEQHADAARALLDTSDMADAVAARYFADRAAAAARRVHDGREPAWTRPCYFDPRHDAGTEDVELPGADGMTVPGCTMCARRVDEGELPDAVSVLVRSREVPYYTRTDVWSATGFGALRDDVTDLVLAGGRGGQKPPRAVRE